MKKITNFAGIVLILLNFSCEKETVLDLVPIDFLTGGNMKVWKLSYYKENGKDVLLECYKDDTFYFNKKTKMYSWNVNEIKCNNNDSNQSFKFELSEDNKFLKINGFDYRINKLEINSLEIEIEIGSNFISLGYIPVK